MVMRLAYTLSVSCYHLAIRLAAPFNGKAKKWVDGRKKWKSKLVEAIDPKAKYAWFHCASLGEFEQGRPVIEAFRKAFPTYKVMLTFYSPSGFEVRKNYAEADVVCYLPPDSKGNANYFLETVKPSVAVFVKYEFWFHFLNGLQKRDVPTILISAIFREEQHFFKAYGGFARKMLSAFSHFFVQDQNSAELLKSIGKENVVVAGDTRFDRVVKVADEAQSIPLVDQFLNGEKAFVAGSTWEQDEALLADLFASKGWKGKMILAPHEVDEPHIEKIVGKFKAGTVVRFSSGFTPDWTGAQILIVDTIGLLNRIYKYGWIAYIGGGFGKGIHNILEPATFGMPVVFGPEWRKFREAKVLQERNGATSISNADELKAFYQKMQSNPELLQEWSDNARSYVTENAGATEKIMTYLRSADF